jgi:hypothetical protein
MNCDAVVYSGMIFVGLGQLKQKLFIIVTVPCFFDTQYIVRANFVEFSVLDSSFLYLPFLNLLLTLRDSVNYCLAFIGLLGHGQPCLVGYIFGGK